MRTVGRRKSDRYRVLAGMLLGAVLTSYAVYVSSCGGSHQDPTSQTPLPEAAIGAASAPSTTPTPVPVAEQPSASPDHDVTIFNGGTFTVLNNSGIPANYVWYKTSFDDQKTPIWGPKQQIIGSGGTLNADFGNPICEQGDIAIGDYHNVPIGFAFFDKLGQKFNPSSSPEKVAECRKCDPQRAKWVEVEERTIGEWADYVPDALPEAVAQICYKFQRRLIIVFERNDCSRETRELRRFFETRQVEIPCPCVEPSPAPETPGAYSWLEGILEGKCEVEHLPVVIGPSSVTDLNCHRIGTQKFTQDLQCSPDVDRIANLCQNVACPCLYPTATFQLGTLTYPPYTGFAYYQMNQGNDTSRENACENRGGTWLNDYNIPNDGEGEQSNVCRFPIPLPPGAPGADVTFLFKAVTGGNPISGSATVSGAGTWKLILRATNPGNFEKDVKEVTLTCNSQPAVLSVSYNWVGHESESWKLELYLNGVLKATSPTVSNPTN